MISVPFRESGVGLMQHVGTQTDDVGSREGASGRQPHSQMGALTAELIRLWTITDDLGASR